MILIDNGKQGLTPIKGGVIRYKGELVVLNYNAVSSPKIWKDPKWAQRAIDRRIKSLESGIKHGIINSNHSYHDELELLKQCTIGEVK